MSRNGSGAVSAPSAKGDCGTATLRVVAGPGRPRTFVSRLGEGSMSPWIIFSKNIPPTAEEPTISLHDSAICE